MWAIFRDGEILEYTASLWRGGAIEEYAKEEPHDFTSVGDFWIQQFHLGARCKKVRLVLVKE